ncbi:hypothetical protein BaRGS_00022535 [Batillaria attramentaria]|uniref:Uncharacterized protein n=1 Tax=Batillaria attramentaria TaxID=370345 RepID=A0ABD0KGQ4_9CAEN
MLQYRTTVGPTRRGVLRSLHVVLFDLGASPNAFLPAADKQRRQVNTVSKLSVLEEVCWGSARGSPAPGDTRNAPLVVGSHDTGVGAGHVMVGDDHIVPNTRRSVHKYWPTRCLWRRR